MLHTLLFSTGFRAPALHQIYLSNIQTLVSGGKISNQGTFNNVDPAVIGLGVPRLHAEESQNIATGITFRSGLIFLRSIFYHIKVKDRVLFSGEVGFDGDDTTTNPVEKYYLLTILLVCFINAVNTITKGVDVVLNYKNLEIGTGRLGFSLASNTNTKIDGKSRHRLF
jgi:iron complex outermembrane receptor protein